MAKRTTTRRSVTRKVGDLAMEPAGKKGVTVGDLPAETERTRSAKGGFTTANDHARTAVYQHNQTDLEFVRRG